MIALRLPCLSQLSHLRSWSIAKSTRQIEIVGIRTRSGKAGSVSLGLCKVISHTRSFMEGLHRVGLYSIAAELCRWESVSGLMITVQHEATRVK